MQEPWVQSLGWKDPLEEGMATHSRIPAWRIPMDREAWWAPVHGVARVGHDLDFPGGSDSKASAYNAGDLGSIPGLGRSPGEGNGNPLQYSCLENPMDGGAW